jgi:hypothetical protein
MSFFNKEGFVFDELYGSASSVDRRLLDCEPKIASSKVQSCKTMYHSPKGRTK